MIVCRSQRLPGSASKRLLQCSDTVKSRDIPEHLKIAFRPAPGREDNVFGSKAVGEPPFMLAISMWEALRDAVASTKVGGQLVEMDAPATAENVLRALGGQ